MLKEGSSFWQGFGLQREEQGGDGGRVVGMEQEAEQKLEEGRGCRGDKFEMGDEGLKQETKEHVLEERRKSERERQRGLGRQQFLSLSRVRCKQKRVEKERWFEEEGLAS